MDVCTATINASASGPSTDQIKIRAYDEKEDRERADELDRICEAGPNGKMSLYTDLLGDPLCRVRHYPAYHMLVAEREVRGGKQAEMVGLIRAGVKEISCGSSSKSNSPTFAMAAYLLGLRVAPHHRRLGIGARLVREMEEWCRGRGVQYVYIATEKDNEASVKLFNGKLGYVKFRSPAILVQPVYEGRKKLTAGRSGYGGGKQRRQEIEVQKLEREEAERLYKALFEGVEFYPRDIGAVMESRLHRGTWRATWTDKAKKVAGGGDDVDAFAVMSLWSCHDIFRLHVSGAPLALRCAAAASRALARVVACCGAGPAVPTVPDVFRPFGLQLMYGLRAVGPSHVAAPLVHQLCRLAHNLARQQKGCAVVAAEVGACDPLRHVIPHWRSLSCDEDLWCIKRLSSPSSCPALINSNHADNPADNHHHPDNDDDDEGEEEEEYNWCKSAPPPCLFADPRDF